MSKKVSKESENEAVKLICPKGKILNDNGVDVDHLCHVVYADALAQQIETIKSPVAIGIFSRWGSGKSFLMKHVQNLLMRTQKREKKKKELIPSKINTLSFILIVFIMAVVGITVATSVYDDIPVYIGIILLVILFLFLMTCFAVISSNSNTSKSWYRFSKLIGYSLLTQLPIRENKVAYIPTFVQTNYIFKEDKSIPKKTSTELQDVQTHRRFIFVNFNAWQYAGCDTLWAGIVTTMAEKIEEEFGVFTTRVFRSLTLDSVEKPIFECGQINHLLIEFKEDTNRGEHENVIKEGLKKYSIESPKKLEDWEKKESLCVEIKNKDSCWVIEFKDLEITKQAHQELKSYKDIKTSFLDTSNSEETVNVRAIEKNGLWNHFTAYPRTNYIAVMFGIFMIVITSIALFVYLFTKDQAIKNVNHTSIQKLVGGILASFPAGLTVIFGLFKLSCALFYSHRGQIIKAVQGAKKDFSNELGFMSNIKKEIQSMTDLIHAIELSHNLEYKVIITVDDLDRVPLPKVKSVLEAVNILLSDQNSPFICLIAIDSRIANACFTAGVDSGGISRTINGYEYMKKIINLPFCLPEIDDESKTSYIGGLIDESDETKEEYTTIKMVDKEYVYADEIRSIYRDKNDASISGDESSNASSLQFHSFLFQCRKLMYTDKELLKHVLGNPRNMKRIFNIISMTVSLIVSKKKRENQSFINSFKPRSIEDEHTNADFLQEFTKQILYWIVLTDQWPYRISYMLVVIAEDNLKLPDDQAFTDETKLTEVYLRSLKEENDVIYSSSHDELMSLDYDPKLLHSLLSTCGSFLNVGNVKELLTYTTNLDRSIMKSICFTRYKIIQQKFN